MDGYIATDGLSQICKDKKSAHRNAIFLESDHSYILTIRRNGATDRTQQQPLQHNVPSKRSLCLLSHTDHRKCQFASECRLTLCELFVAHIAYNCFRNFNNRRNTKTSFSDIRALKYP